MEGDARGGFFLGGVDGGGPSEVEVGDFGGVGVAAGELERMWRLEMGWMDGGFGEDVTRLSELGVVVGLVGVRDSMVVLLLYE